MFNDDIDQTSPGIEFARDVIQNWMENCKETEELIIIPRKDFLRDFGDIRVFRLL